MNWWFLALVVELVAVVLVFRSARKNEREVGKEHAAEAKARAERETRLAATLGSAAPVVDAALESSMKRARKAVDSALGAGR